MAHLLTQPQQKLQLNYKTTVTQNHQKMEPYGSLTTRILKKSHLSRQVGGVETGDTEQAVTHQCVVDKNQEEYVGCEGS